MSGFPPQFSIPADLLPTSFSGFKFTITRQSRTQSNSIINRRKASANSTNPINPFAELKKWIESGSGQKTISDLERFQIKSYIGEGYVVGSAVKNLTPGDWIRRKMMEIMVNQSTSCNLNELVKKFIPESIGKEIEKATSSIYPLQNVYIRKVTILKAPKFDFGKLMEVHGDYSEDVGMKVDMPLEETVADAPT
ncbi:hypothetical protein QQ045_010942 [Rhodiola kirilowii]